MYISKRTAVLVVVILLAVGAIWFGLSRRGSEPANAATSRNDASAAAVATVELRPAVSSITVPGVFQAYQDVLIHAKVSGYIKQIFVDIGDRVHSGQVLAILEVPELNAQVDAAQAAVMRDKSEIQRTRHDVSRAVAIHAAQHAEYARLGTAASKLPGLVAQQELDDKQAQDLSSAAQVDAAKSAYAAAQAKMTEDLATLEHYKALQAYSYVRAPFDGVITYRYADTGALIAAGTDESSNAMPIVRLAQSGLLRLRMPVPESDADYMKIGGPAVVRVQATGETINTKIVRFTRSMDRSTRTMLTEVDIPNPDLHLAPGMYADTTFPLQSVRQAMMVPIDAIVEGDQPYVLVVDDTNHVVKAPVVLGIQGPNFYQIDSGVKVGDRVIVGNQSDYQPGQLVTPSPVDMDLTSFSQTAGPSRGNSPSSNSTTPPRGRR
ncbi:MAG TPA: efflux RND transporter periplasmic adaptor subunit [Acidobacteriaceae bacterium]|nr:efflux RND transporter periplasmic adaptor subunit [Acidobacteriaceae bacterium]